VVTVTMRYQQHVASFDAVGRPGAAWIAEPRIDEDDLVARRSNLDARLAVPRDGRLAADVHGLAPPTAS